MCETLILRNHSRSTSYLTPPIFDLLSSLFYDVSAFDLFIKVTKLIPLKLKESLI